MAKAKDGKKRRRRKKSTPDAVRIERRMTEEARIKAGTTPETPPDEDMAAEKRRLRALLVEDLYIKHWTQKKIAEELTTRGYAVSQKTVSNDLERLRKEWKAERLLEFTAEKDRELKTLDALEVEAWDAWQRSKRLTETTKSAVDGASKVGGTRRSATERVKETPGDPEFLRMVALVVDKRCKILGIYAPKIKEWRGDEAARKLAALLNVNPEEIPS